ncbi:MAG: FMN-binding protein [Oscillospiraceae bacterium]|nr:FMN-binding protein [Oscillospiraceae bacterium]
MLHVIKNRKQATRGKLISCLSLLAVCLLLISGCANDAPPALTPGVYIGIGTGHGGDIEVQLTVDAAGRIADLQILSENETPAYAAYALELLPKAIVDGQSLGIDAVSSATISSRAILAAAAAAVVKAGGDPKNYGFISAGEYSDAAEILLTGLPGGDITVTGERLRSDFEITELDTVSINSTGTEKTVRAKGVLLETILQKNGVSQKEFGSATANSADGYSVMITGEIFQNRDLLIAFEINGEVIPPRMVVPEERAMYWVKNLSAIEFAEQAQVQPVTKEISLNELFASLKDRAEDYRYGGIDCKALPVALILNEIGAEQTRFVTIKSSDGLEKTERYSTFAAQMLLIEGMPEAPMYIGPSLPEGMRVKNVSSFQIGGILVKAD